MKRQSKAGGKSDKAGRHKAKPKRSGLPKAIPNRRIAKPAQEKEIARRARERNEALQQLSAASNVLKVISSSRGELEPVFRTVLESAVELCKAKFGTLFLF